MAERDIATVPDPVLREQAKSVGKVDPSVKKLAEEMIETMQAWNGLGLAANQIGVLQKVFVYDDGSGSGPGVIINPKIVRAEGEQIGVEGCLSVPGLQGEVRRAHMIEMKGTDLNGKPVKVKAEGLLARIFQHELDHLNGTLFVDRADPETLHYVTLGDEEPEEQEAGV